MDRIKAKKERLDEYDGIVKTDPGQYDLRKDLDNMNDVLEEIEYYRLLIKYDVFEESALLKNDRRKVYEIWRTLNLGKDVQDKIRKLKLEKKSNIGKSRSTS